MSLTLKLLAGAFLMAAMCACSTTTPETDAKVMGQQIQIIRERIDPQGVIDPIIRSVGRDGIEIALPTTAGTH